MVLNENNRQQLEGIIKKFVASPQAQDVVIDLRFVMHRGRLTGVKRLHGEEVVMFEKPTEVRR